ncbi:hypothetical protein KR018_011737, partial [Drosophila ironensis]
MPLYQRLAYSSKIEEYCCIQSAASCSQLERYVTQTSSANVATIALPVHQSAACRRCTDSTVMGQEHFPVERQLLLHIASMGRNGSGQRISFPPNTT